MTRPSCPPAGAPSCRNPRETGQERGPLAFQPPPLRSPSDRRASGSDARTVDRPDVVLDLLEREDFGLEEVLNRFEGAVVSLLREVGVDGLPLPELLRQVSPGSYRSVHPQDGLHHSPLVHRWPASPAGARREEMLKPWPLLVSETMPCHRELLHGRRGRRRDPGSSDQTRDRLSIPTLRQFLARPLRAGRSGADVRDAYSGAKEQSFVAQLRTCDARTLLLRPCFQESAVYRARCDGWQSELFTRGPRMRIASNRYLKRPWELLAFALSFAAAAPDARGTVPLIHTWNQPEYHFYVNSSSFVAYANGPDLNLTAHHWEEWIGYVATTWVEETGVALDVQFLGSSSAGCLVVNDGISSIGVEPGCFQNDCVLYNGRLGTHSHNAAAQTSDICVHAGARGGMQYDIELDKVTNGTVNYDIVALLFHEVGHALGLAHSSAPGPLRGTNGEVAFSRHATGELVDALREEYGFRKVPEGMALYDPATEWFPALTTKPGHVALPTDGTFAFDGVQLNAVRAAIAASGAGLWIDWTRDYLPPGWNSATWSNRYIAAAASRHPPAITGRHPLSPELLAVTIQPYDDLSKCSVLEFRRTSDFFANFDYQTKIACTNVGVDVSFDSTSNRYVMVTVQQTTGC